MEQENLSFRDPESKWLGWREFSKRQKP